MFWFVTYTAADNSNVCKRFSTIDEFFKWLQEFKDEFGYPKNYCLYKGECVFDGS